MEALLVLAAIAAVPILIGIVFRVSAILLFASVAAGSLLVTYFADDAGLALGMAVKQNSNQIAQFALLLIPVVLTLLVLRKTMPRTKMLLHIPVLVAVGLMLAVLALPLLDSGAQAKIFENEYGNMLREFQDIIVGVAAGATVLLMLLTQRHKDEGHKKHKK